MILIVLQPDLGSAAMLAPLLAGMLLIAGVRLRLLAAAALVLLLVGTAGWTFAMKDYQRDRVLTFLAPGSDPLGAGYQVRQSKIAVGSGELTGRGYMQGTQSQLRFLPARHTDFIFSVLAEEWGFLGVVTVLGLFATFIVSGLRIAMRARDRGGILLVVGFLSLFTFHVLYNTAMVVGLMPITGIPLPFLSYGGSFMLLNLVGTGLILNVDVRRYVNR
jgi:rod shape determining protein RodA